MSLIEMVPDRLPVVEGENATEIVHVAEGARLCPQLCVTGNSVVPAIEVNVSGAVPAFVSTTPCRALVEPTT